MKLYITIMRSDADDLGPFDDDIDAQATCDYFDFLIMHEVKYRFDDIAEQVPGVEFKDFTRAEIKGYGLTIPAIQIEDLIEEIIEKLYKQPDRWLVKKGASVESPRI